VNLFGRRQQPDPVATQETDEQALARYRYMLATAPPEDIERAHEEAFAKLTPEQRRQALEALAQHVPGSELRGDDPASLARAATRAEIRQPGTIERAWGSGAAGFGLGSWFMTTLAASFIGTAIAQSFFDNDPGAYAGDQPTDAGSDGSDGSDTADAGSGDQGDFGGDDFGGGDLGGGDLGGGDFGGGDFGGF
jgi:hypothetical protein